MPSEMVDREPEDDFEEQEEVILDPLDKNKILLAKDIVVKRVNVPEWGGSVYVRVLSGVERDRLERMGAEKKTHNFRGIFASLAIANEDGTRMFTDADAKALGEKNGAALQRIIDAGVEVNKLSGESIEELEKN